MNLVVTTLSEAVNKVYKENWTLTTNFAVHFYPTEKSKILWDKCGMPSSDINLYLKSFQIPAIGNTNLIENFINDRVRTAMSYFDPFDFQLTFKDHNSFEFYRAFLKYVIYSKNTYLENYAFTMKIFKLKDFPNDKENFEVMSFSNCAISQVSGISLDNSSESQIAEFTANIKTTKLPVINGEVISEGNTYSDFIKKE